MVGRIANSVDPDQTAPLRSSLIRVYTGCSGTLFYPVPIIVMIAHCCNIDFVIPSCYKVALSHRQKLSMLKPTVARTTVLDYLLCLLEVIWALAVVHQDIQLNQPPW